MSTGTPSAIVTAKAIKQMREEAAAKALWKLKNETIPSLEAVIAGTPSGVVRNQLTDANVILHMVATST